MVKGKKCENKEVTGESEIGKNGMNMKQRNGKTGHSFFCQKKLQYPFHFIVCSVIINHQAIIDYREKWELKEEQYGQKREKTYFCGTEAKRKF